MERCWNRLHSVGLLFLSLLLVSLLFHSWARLLGGYPRHKAILVFHVMPHGAGTVHSASISIA